MATPGAATSHPLNRGVLSYLGQGAEPESVVVERADDSTDTWRLGAHPDIVARLWTTLAAQLPQDCRHLVNGGAALVHPGTGIILAVALGTTYALRVTDARLAAARSAGYETRHEYRSVGRTLDLEATFGPGWIFGRELDDEPAWVAETYRSL